MKKDQVVNNNNIISHHMPDFKTCHLMANTGYKPDIIGIDHPDWEMVQNNEYVASYKNEATKTIIVAIRCTNPKDTALDSLISMQNVQKFYLPSEWWYGGVSNSLDCALLDIFINLRIIQNGINCG